MSTPPVSPTYAAASPYGTDSASPTPMAAPSGDPWDLLPPVPLTTATPPPGTGPTPPAPAIRAAAEAFLLPPAGWFTSAKVSQGHFGPAAHTDAVLNVVAAYAATVASDARSVQDARMTSRLLELRCADHPKNQSEAAARIQTDLRATLVQLRAQLAANGVHTPEGRLQRLTICLLWYAAHSEAADNALSQVREYVALAFDALEDPHVPCVPIDTDGAPIPVGNAPTLPQILSGFFQGDSAQQMGLTGTPVETLAQAIEARVRVFLRS